MTSRIDELFSAEKLRQNWHRPVAPDHKPPAIALNLAIHAHYQKMQELLIAKYVDISCLSVNFDELTDAINQAYPLEDVSPLLDEEEKQRIVGLLEHLENLIWAMSLSTGGSE
jgi:hypothetical protein